MGHASFHELADRELNDAAQYYELETPGLGAAFVNEVERCVRAVLQHPEAGIAIQGVVRRRLLRRFPYALLYSIKSDGVRILAVMNQKRRPTYWVGRQ
jgi:toxin ParE1/3/4